MSLIRLSMGTGSEVRTPPTPSDPVATVILSASAVLVLLLVALCLLASPLRPVPSQVLDGLTTPTPFNALTT